MDRRCCDGARGVGELRRPVVDGGPIDRVARTQAKYHRWAKTDRDVRFGDLFNLVCHPDYLRVAWDHVAHNKGARTAGIDGVTVRQIVRGRAGRGSSWRRSPPRLKDGTYRPAPVRRVLIPKPGGKSRPLGIPTVTDRVVQQSLRMVLEPIFEADFLPVSYGFRPRRRAHDAVAEIHYYASRGYRWVLDADIKGCFDNIDHQVILDRVRATDLGQKDRGAGPRVPQGRCDHRAGHETRGT